MKIGVIGAAGKIGRMRVRSVLENANTSLVAVMDLNIEAANAVAPGFIATPMTDKLTDDQKANINGQIPAARMGTAEEIAAAVLYLASQEAAYTTGATLHVNGGMAML